MVFTPIVIQLILLNSILTIISIALKFIQFKTFQALKSAPMYIFVF
jgi:hypothetical protein